LIVYSALAELDDYESVESPCAVSSPHKKYLSKTLQQAKHMTKKSLILGLLMLISSGLMAQNSSEEEEVKAVIKQLFEGMQKTDSTLVRSTLDPSARLQTTGIGKDGKAYLRTESVDGFIKSVGTPHKELYDERILSYEIRIDLTMATAWTPYEFYVDDRKNHCGVNAFQLYKSANGWKIIQITDTRKKEGCQ
jgi:hypothetical protein